MWFDIGKSSLWASLTSVEEVTSRDAKTKKVGNHWLNIPIAWILHFTVTQVIKHCKHAQNCGSWPCLSGIRRVYLKPAWLQIWGCKCWNQASAIIKPAWIIIIIIVFLRFLIVLQMPSVRWLHSVWLMTLCFRCCILSLCEQEEVTVWSESPLDFRMKKIHVDFKTENHFKPIKSHNKNSSGHHS